MLRLSFDGTPTTLVADAISLSHSTRSVCTYLPIDYEPNYAYPLIVAFHGRGCNEVRTLRLVPQISRRNYIGLSLRGPQSLGFSDEGQPAFGWGRDGELDPHTEEYILQAILESRREFHIHSERVYLLGLGEGATAAYRMALTMPGKLAGVIAINGTMPDTIEMQNDRIRFGANFRVFIAHAKDHPTVSLSAARSDFQKLHTSGADVRFRAYSTAKLQSDLCVDIDKWVMRNIYADMGYDYEF